MYSFVSGDSVQTHDGITLPTSTQNRLGDLLVAEALAQGSHFGNSINIGQLVPLSNAAPLQYIHSITDLGGSSDPRIKALTFGAPSGRSRQVSALLQTNEFIMTIKSVLLRASSRQFVYTPTVNLVFDAGQEFTKDNLHKLLIAYWQITWGP
jgi:hypothetical protein